MPSSKHAPSKSSHAKSNASTQKGGVKVQSKSSSGKSVTGRGAQPSKGSQPAGGKSLTGAASAKGPQNPRGSSAVKAPKGAVRGHQKQIPVKGPSSAKHGSKPMKVGHDSKAQLRQKPGHDSAGRAGHREEVRGAGQNKQEKNIKSLKGGAKQDHSHSAKALGSISGSAGVSQGTVRGSAAPLGGGQPLSKSRLSVSSKPSSKEALHPEEKNRASHPRGKESPKESKFAAVAKGVATGRAPEKKSAALPGKSLRASVGGKGSRSRLDLESVCREVACDGLSILSGYCRLHYIKNWKKIKRKEVILREKKLNQYIEELVLKYPEKYIEAISQDLANDKEFAKVIHDLDLDETVDDFEGEGEGDEGLIDTIKRDIDEDAEGF